MADDETMTTTQVAEHLGMTAKGAQSWLSRLGIEAVARQPGRNGQNLYRRTDILNARPLGRGYRQDLHGPPGV